MSGKEFTNLSGQLITHLFHGKLDTQPCTLVTHEWKSSPLNFFSGFPHKRTHSRVFIRKTERETGSSASCDTDEVVSLVVGMFGGYFPSTLQGGAPGPRDVEDQSAGCRVCQPPYLSRWFFLFFFFWGQMGSKVGRLGGSRCGKMLTNNTSKGERWPWQSVGVRHPRDRFFVLSWVT